MKRLFAAAALAPLCVAALDAQAQTQTSITEALKTPVKTSTAGNVDVTSTGSVTVSGGGAAITVDSDNTVKTTGTISVRDTPGGDGILVVTDTDGLTGGLTIGGSIAADDTKANSDVDKDGDLDGPFVPDDVVRNGIRVTGEGAFNGNIEQTGGTIAVEGNNGSAGIRIDTALNGNLITKGTIGVLGTNSVGVHVRGPVDGNVSIGGLINTQGEGSQGVVVEAPVTGVIRIDGAINATGYRYIDINNLPTRVENLDADDLLIGGSAVRIMAGAGKGLVIDRPPGDAQGSVNDDEDGDGFKDSEEGTGVIHGYGPAPALAVGAQNDISFGALGGALGDFGIAIQGNVIGHGLYDGIDGHAVQIGGYGGAVDTNAGILISAEVATGNVYRGDATGLLLGAGAKVPLLVVDGGRIAAGVDAQGHGLAEGVDPTARALVIDQGATVDQLVNNGIIETGISGANGHSIALVDHSGTLRNITNLGTISGQINTGDIDLAPIGERIGLDLRANTTGVDLFQRQNPGVAAPVIRGDVLFGTGDSNNNFSVDAGSVTGGAIDFGGGQDNFFIGEDAAVRADLRKPSGELNVAVLGELNLTNTNMVALESLSVGSEALVSFTADPQNADPARRIGGAQVAGDLILDNGSRLDIEFISKLDGPMTFELLRAGRLIDLGVDTSLVSTLPFLFAGQGRVAGDSVEVEVRPRTAAELGLTGGRAAVYDAFYSAFDADPGVARAFFDKVTQEDFTELYEQFLPDYSGGPFNGLATGARAVFQAQSEEARGMVAGEPRSWLQEVGVGTRFESVNDVEYQTGGLGFAGGVERPWRGNQVVGFSGSFISSEIRNANRRLGSLLTGSVVMSSVYWRAQEGGMVIDASFGGGYAWFDSNRRIIDQDASGRQNLIRQADADWSGAIAAARVGVAYNWDAGPFYVRHDAVLDGVWLREGGYTETGGGAGVNLSVRERDSYEVGAEAGILLGARFGRGGFRWGPEVRVAYRGILDGGEGETLGNFVSSPDQPFILPGLIKDRQRIVVRAALRGAGAYSNFALEATGDIGEIYQAYMARVIVRFLF